MQARVNIRCSKEPTAAQAVRLSDTELEVWIGHDKDGRYAYGWIVTGTPDELKIIAALCDCLNNLEVAGTMLPGDMNEAAGMRARGEWPRQSLREM